MRQVYILGVHTLAFGKYPEQGIKDLATGTVQGCLRDAGIAKEQIEALWFANSGWGHSTGQDCIRGQVALRAMGIEAIPITNVENACASGSTAFHHAWLGVASGLYDVTMAVGAEKLYQPNKTAVFAGFLGGIDIENCLQNVSTLSTFGLTESDHAAVAAWRTRYPQKASAPRRESLRDRVRRRVMDTRDALAVGVDLGEKLGYRTMLELRKLSSGDHSPFMDIYGYAARQHMARYGTTLEQLAAVASKSHHNGSLNPNAQYRFEASVADILSDRLVSFPLTRSMCAPIGDGAASAILCSEQAYRRLSGGLRAVRVRASILGSGMEYTAGSDTPSIGERLAVKAYAMAGAGPQDMHLAEVHDATVFGEICQVENLGFCAKGEGGRLAEKGDTALGGRIPVNPSGGLVSRGHPIGASGLAQLHELTVQLQGRATGRQVESPRMAIAENGGGALGQEEAAMCIHILEATSL